MNDKYMNELNNVSRDMHKNYNGIFFAKQTTEISNAKATIIIKTFFVFFRDIV